LFIGTQNKYMAKKQAVTVHSEEVQAVKFANSVRKSYSAAKVTFDEVKSNKTLLTGIYRW
jgi:lactam utilization protein B